MIPVNNSGPFVRSGMRDDEQVIAEAPDVGEFVAVRVRDRGDAEVAEREARSADERGREVDEQLVGEPGGHEGARERGPSLDEERADAA